MKHIVIYGCIACMMLGILSGCRSSKQVAEVQEPKEEWVDKMATGALKEGTVSGKLNLQLSDGAKSVSVGGSCSFERDKAIQISLVALGFMEVGRLEMTPDYLLMIDRMGRQYVKVNYADVPYLQSAGIDFYTFQALFWNDLFVPGSGRFWNEQDFDMNRTAGGSQVELVTNSTTAIQARFLLDLATGMVRNTVLGLQGQPTMPALKWSYLHFGQVNKKSFPDNMQLTIESAGKSYRATFGLGNLKSDSKAIKLTDEPGSRYKKVDVQSILKMLSK